MRVLQCKYCYQFRWWQFGYSGTFLGCDGEDMCHFSRLDCTAADGLKIVLKFSVLVRVDNQPVRLQLCDTAGQVDFISQLKKHKIQILNGLFFFLQRNA